MTGIMPDKENGRRKSLGSMKRFYKKGFKGAAMLMLNF